jgi:hypothetical protein
MKKRRINKQPKIIFTGIKFDYSLRPKHYMWGMILLFVIVQVYFMIQNATSGAELADLEKKAAAEERMHNELSEKLVTSTSLTTAGDKAIQLGYKQPAKVIYLNNDEFALKLP